MNDKPNITEAERAELVAYLDGEVDQKTAMTIEAKLGRDPRVRSEADQLKRTWELLDYLPRPAPSPDFTHRTLERLTVNYPPRHARWQFLPRWRPSKWTMGWAAAALIVGAVGFFGARFLSPSRPPVAEAEPQDVDPEMVIRDRRVIENRRLYEHIVGIDFLRELANPDDPDLFGDDQSGS
jgi:anti-sigma factor RsiW